jgi:hypothetical protein
MSATTTKKAPAATKKTAKAAPKAPPAKPAASKATPAKKTAKKAPAQDTKKAEASTKKSDSVRVRALKALKSGDMTASEVRDKIGLGHNLKPTLDQEVERGHLTSVEDTDKHSLVYKLTAAGKKALEAGTVDPSRKVNAK